MRYFILLLMLGFLQNHKAQSLDDYVQLGQYAEAIDEFSKLEQPTTEDELALAKAYCAKGMTIDCLKAYQQALEKVTPDAFLQSKFKYAKILQTQKQYQKADSLYDGLLKMMPSHAEILYQKGRIAEVMKKPAYHQLYLEALTYDPKHIKAAHEASRYFMRVDNYKLAKNICLKTLEKVPNTPRLINLMGQIHYREDEWETSLKYIEVLEKLKSDLPKFVYEIKGNNYLKLQQHDKAVLAFKKAFFQDTKDYQLSLKIGETYLYLNKPKKAIRYLITYERLRDTSMWRFNFLMGKYYMQSQNYKMAFYQFQKAYDENFNHEDSQYFRAVAADNFMEDKSKALDYYTNYIETYEDEEDAKYINIALRRETEIRRELFMKE